MAEELPAGVVECDDFTKGRRARRTVSKIPHSDWQPWWGRQDFAVYIVAVPPLFLALATIPVWWPLLATHFPGPATAAISLAIIVGIPVLCGGAASITGLNSRDIPRHLDTIWARRPRVMKAEAAFNRAAPEPRVHFRPQAWLLPEPAPAATIVKHAVRIPFQGVVELCPDEAHALERAAHYGQATVVLARPDIVAEYEASRPRITIHDEARA